MILCNVLCVITLYLPMFVCWSDLLSFAVRDIVIPVLLNKEKIDNLKQFKIGKR